MPPKGVLHFRTCLATESRLSKRVASTIEICTPLQRGKRLSCKHLQASHHQSALHAFYHHAGVVQGIRGRSAASELYRLLASMLSKNQGSCPSDRLALSWHAHLVNDE